MSKLVFLDEEEIYPVIKDQGKQLYSHRGVPFHVEVELTDEEYDEWKKVEKEWERWQNILETRMDNKIHNS